MNKGLIRRFDQFDQRPADQVPTQARLLVVVSFAARIQGVREGSHVGVHWLPTRLLESKHLLLKNSNLILANLYFPGNPRETIDRPRFRCLKMLQHPDILQL